MESSSTNSTLQAAKQLREEIKQSAMQRAHLLDSLDQGLQASLSTLDQLKTKPEAPSNLLSGQAPIPFPPARRKLTKTWLNQLYSKQKPCFDKATFKGISAAKNLKAEAYAAWLSERGIDVQACWTASLSFPSPDELLAFWRAQGSPALSSSDF